MYFPSLLQKYWVTGRFVSLVISFAEVHGASTGFTQTFRVSLYGLRNEMYFPSGEICAPEISGLPKKSSRSMSGGSLPFWAVRAGALVAMAIASAQRVETVRMLHPLREKYCDGAGLTYGLAKSRTSSKSAWLCEPPAILDVPV